MRFTERDGTATTFQNGQVAFVKDANGNQVTVGYSNGRLTSLTASSGQSITLSYNVAGRISAVTNSQGQSAQYIYDASNTYLLSVTDQNGYTTNYTYDSGTNPALTNALLSITDPGSSRFFSYDAQGRLSKISQQAVRAADPVRIQRFRGCRGLGCYERHDYVFRRSAWSRNQGS